MEGNRGIGGDNEGGVMGGDLEGEYILVCMALKGFYTHAPK